MYIIVAAALLTGSSLVTCGLLRSWMLWFVPVTSAWFMFIRACCAHSHCGLWRDVSVRFWLHRVVIRENCWCCGVFNYCFLRHSKESNHNESASSPPKVKSKWMPMTSFNLAFVNTLPSVVLRLLTWLPSCLCMPDFGWTLLVVQRPGPPPGRPELTPSPDQSDDQGDKTSGSDANAEPTTTAPQVRPILQNAQINSLNFCFNWSLFVSLVY